MHGPNGSSPQPFRAMFIARSLEEGCNALSQMKTKLASAHVITVISPAQPPSPIRCTGILDGSIVSSV